MAAYAPWLTLDARSLMVTYSIPDSILVQQVVSETVLLDAAKGEYYELNEMGSEMLRRLRDQGDPDRVIAALLDEYSVTRQQLQEDMDSLLSNLMTHGLLLRHDDASTL